MPKALSKSDRSEGEAQIDDALIDATELDIFQLVIPEKINLTRESEKLLPRDPLAPDHKENVEKMADAEATKQQVETTTSFVAPAAKDNNSSQKGKKRRQKTAAAAGENVAKKPRTKNKTPRRATASLRMVKQPVVTPFDEEKYKPLFSSFSIIRRPFALEGQKSMEIEITDTYVKGYEPPKNPTMYNVIVSEGLEIESTVNADRPIKSEPPSFENDEL